MESGLALQSHAFARLPPHNTSRKGSAAPHSGQRPCIVRPRAARLRPSLLDPCTWAAGALRAAQRCLHCLPACRALTASLLAPSRRTRARSCP